VKDLESERVFVAAGAGGRGLHRVDEEATNSEENNNTAVVYHYDITQTE
jgi:hypothetical protein